MPTQENKETTAKLPIRETDEDTSTSNCGKCENNFKKEDISILCDGICAGWYHKDCAGLTNGEFEILKRKNCKLLWLCELCQKKTLNREENKTKKEDETNLTQKIDSIMNFLTNQLGTVVEEKVKSMLEREGRITVIKEHIRTVNGGKHTDNGPGSEGKTLAPVVLNRRGEQGKKQTEKDEEKVAQHQAARGNGGTKENEHGNANRKVDEGEQEELQAAEKIAWIFVGRLKATTNSEMVSNYMTKRGVREVIECEEIRSRGPNKAYKVGIPFGYLQTIQDPDFWPNGVQIKRYRFRRQYNEGASLEDREYDEPAYGQRPSMEYRRR